MISSAVANGQAAACWIAISKNGRFAYTTNAASGSISSYQIGKDGSLTLLNPTAGLTGPGSSPVDLAFRNSGQYLYALAGGAHTINIFQMHADGSLGVAGSISVPVGVVGLAAHQSGLKKTTVLSKLWLDTEKVGRKFLSTFLGFVPRSFP